MRSSLLYLSLLLPVLHTYAATYYVDNCVITGADSNDGTSVSRPWRTLARVNAAVFAPGDSILFRNGCRWAGELMVSQSGDVGRPLTFGSYGSGVRALIDGTGKPSAVAVYGQSDVTIDNLELDSGGYADVVFSGGSSGFILSHCVLRRSGSQYWVGRPGYRQGAAVLVNNTRGGTISDNVIVDSYRGIELSGYGPVRTDAVHVTENTISYSGQTGIDLTDGVTHSIVEHNDIAYSAQSYDDTAGIYAAHSGAGNVIKYNRILSGGTVSNRSAGIMIDGGSAAAFVCGNLIAFNTNGCIDEGSGNPSRIYNNTCYHNNQQGADSGELDVFYGPGAGVIFRNNIAVASPGKHIVESAPHTYLDYNLYYGGSATPFSWGGIAHSYDFAAWRAMTSQDTHSPAPADPLFVSANAGEFTLRPASPAIGRGIRMKSDPDLTALSVAGGGAVECPTGDIGAPAHTGASRMPAR